MVFSTPRGQYEGYDQTIGGEKTSDDPFQVSNNEFHGGYTCGQHDVLTKVAKIGKNSHNFEVQKIAVIQAKSVFYRKIRFLQHWRVKMPNFVGGLNNLSEVVSSPIAICSR